ncbi:MAG: DUF4250 domain-containing protein [Clostridiaceae bacterium]
MDPNILYSLVNTRLRDFHEDLASFCYDNGLHEDEFQSFMADHNFHYNKKLNQFR